MGPPVATISWPFGYWWLCISELFGMTYVYPSMSEHFFSGVGITLSLWQHAFFGSLQVAASADATLRSRICSGVKALDFTVRMLFGMEHSLFGTQLWTKF